MFKQIINTVLISFVIMIASLLSSCAQSINDQILTDSQNQSIANDIQASNNSQVDKKTKEDTVEEDLSGYIEYDKEQLYFNDDLRWGMSSEELNDKITLYKCYKTFSNAETKNVYYFYWPYYHKTNTYYLANQQYWLYEDSDKLNSYMLTFSELGHTYDNYIAVKNALVEKYGEPTDEQIDYLDNTYIDNPSKAFEYDYLKIVTSWKNENDFDLVIRWETNMCTVTYSEKGYKGNY